MNYMCTMCPIFATRKARDVHVQGACRHSESTRDFSTLNLNRRWICHTKLSFEIFQRQKKVFMTTDLVYMTTGLVCMTTGLLGMTTDLLTYILDSTPIHYLSIESCLSLDTSLSAVYTSSHGQKDLHFISFFQY